MGVTQQSGDEPDDETVEVSSSRLDKIEQRVERVERENDDLRDRVERVERENDDLRRSLSEARGVINSLRERVDGSLGDDLRERVQSLANDVDSVQQGLANVTGQLNRLKERLVDGDLATEAEESAESASHGVTPETPLESVVALPDHSADDHLSANQTRARWVASKAVELSDKSQAGRTINAGRIRRALSSADRDSRPATVRRVFAFLNELGESDTTVKKQHGRRIVTFHDDTAERLAALADNTVVNQ